MAAPFGHLLGEVANLDQSFAGHSFLAFKSSLDF
jgi:hypothetical protein